MWRRRGGGPVTSPPPPPGSPPASPPPPPPPPSAVIYDGFLGAQTAITKYVTSSSAIGVSLDAAGVVTSVSGHSVLPIPTSLGSGDASVTFDPATERFTISVNQSGVVVFDSFGAGEIDTQGDSSVVYKSVAGNLFKGLVVLKPEDPGAGLDNVVFLGWAAIDSGAFTLDASFIPFGIETANADMPIAGSASYVGNAVGILARTGEKPYDLTGTATASANFASGAVTTTFNFQASGVFPGSTSFTYDELSGTATIAGGDNRFSGTLTSTTDGTLTGGLFGAFYGPGANEIAGVWEVENGSETAIGVFAADSD